MGSAAGFEHDCGPDSVCLAPQAGEWPVMLPESDDNDHGNSDSSDALRVYNVPGR